MRLPPALLAIDIIGTLLLAAGIFGLVADDASIGGVDLEGLALPLLIVGVFLMAPLVLHIVRHALSGPQE